MAEGGSSPDMNLISMSGVSHCITSESATDPRLHSHSGREMDRLSSLCIVPNPLPSKRSLVRACAMTEMMTLADLPFFMPPDAAPAASRDRFHGVDPIASST